MGSERVIQILFILALHLFITVNSVTGQDRNRVTGKILDAADMIPIPYATIQVKELNYNTLSDPEGYFHINNIPTDSLTIKVSFVGYSTALIHTTTAGRDTLVIKLAQQLINMEEVVITAARSERMLKDVPVPTQIISSRQMTTSGLTNVAEIINTIKPGVDFYNEGRGLTFRMQGTPAKYSLFLIDGERIAGENRDNIDYSRLVSGNIERIEIVQGALSSLYGSSAIGGVINLITKTPSTPFECDIYSRYSKFNELETGFSAGSKGKNISYFADAVRKSSNGYDNTPQTPDLYTVEPYNIYSFFNKALFEISEKLNLDARFTYYSRERFDVSDVPKHPFYTDFSAGLKTNYRHSDILSFQASLYRDSYNTYDVLERRNNEKLKTYNNEQISGKFISDLKILNEDKIVNHHITAGLEYLYDEMFASRIQDSLKNNHIISAFLQDEYKIKNNLSIIAGARSDFNFKYGSAFSPKASLMYKKNNMIYRASAATGFRAPGIKELYYDFDLGFIVVKGNENLIPEKSIYTSLAAEYLTGNTNISIVAYNNRLKDMIREQPIEGAPNQYTYENFNNVNIYGSDFLIRTKIARRMTLTSGYSYTFALDLETDNQLKDVSKHMATFSLEYLKKATNHAVGFNFNGKIYGKKEFINMDEITSLFFDDVYQTYSIWRFSVINLFLRNKINVTAGIDNLFDYKPNIDIISIDPGRRYFISLILSMQKN